MKSMAQWAHDYEVGGEIAWSDDGCITVCLGDPVAERWDAETKVLDMAAAERFMRDEVKRLCPRCRGAPAINERTTVIDRLLKEGRGGALCGTTRTRGACG